jgi:ankyrin repeat protein
MLMSTNKNHWLTEVFFSFLPQTMKTVRAKLLSAASENRVPEVKEIVENAPLLNINWTQKESGLGALHRAAQNGHHEVVRLLLGHPLINASQKTHHDGETPLLLACDGGRTEVVRVLLKDSHVELNLADWEKMTPLMCASLEVTWRSSSY